MGPGPTSVNEERPKKPKICREATYSLILGPFIIFAPWLGLFTGGFAIILGIIALSQIKRSQGKLFGRGLAIAGIVLGILAIGLQTAYIMVQVPYARRAAVRSKVSRVKADLRSIATAVEAYYVDYDSYPAWAKGDAGANSFAGPKAGVYHISTFRIWRNENEVGRLYTLTTPVAYITSYPADPWADTRGATFGYYSNKKGWILFSWGPDTDEDDKDSWDLAADVERVYKSSVSQPSVTLIAGASSSPAHEAYTYDSTNGTISPGDIWRVKQ